MRRTILLSLFALLAVGVAHNACAQHRGHEGHGFARAGYHFSRARAASPYRFNRARYSRARAISPYGYGYAYSLYESDNAYPAYDSDAASPYEPQPVVIIQQPPAVVQAPAPPAAKRPEPTMIEEYKWPTASLVSSHAATSTIPNSESQDFSIVLKDGSSLSAEIVFASADGLHYIDPDGRHLRIAISEIDRSATLRLNRARNLNLYLPAAE
ncbi:MAG: hypothetical protein WBD67_12700 [Terracidiphilus sp.]